jgi:O-acetylhomoserine/O-acetylserine sulfhydrylase-like pyridoxal-dependent enzyme
MSFTPATARGPDATPLTTPVYATTTFVFANAAELEAYQEGQGPSVHLLALREPVVQAVEEKLACSRAPSGAW